MLALASVNSNLRLKVTNRKANSPTNTRTLIEKCLSSIFRRERFLSGGVDLATKCANAINLVVTAFVIVVLTPVAIVPFREMHKTIPFREVVA